MFIALRRSDAYPVPTASNVYSRIRSGNVRSQRDRRLVGNAVFINVISLRDRNDIGIEE